MSTCKSLLFSINCLSCVYLPGGVCVQMGCLTWSYASLGFPGSLAANESACSGGDLASIPGLGRSPGEGKGYPLQYSFLENSMDSGAWWATISGVAKSTHWKCVHFDLFSRSVVSDFLQPHGLQHTRFPYSSQSPRVCSNSCALNQ